MKVNKISAFIGAVLFTGALSMAAETFAAESAAGVREHFRLTIETAEAAQKAALEGNKEACLANIKKTKQHYKEITGDAAGKPMQDAMKRIRDAQAECESGNTGTAAEILGETITTMIALQPK